MKIPFLLFITLIIAYFITGIAQAAEIDNFFINITQDYYEIEIPNNDLMNEDYCAATYWNDEDNCIDWESTILNINKEICSVIVFDSPRKRCLSNLKKRGIKI